MNQLAKAFSLLEVDVADDREEIATTVATDHKGCANGRGKGKKKDDSSGGMTISKHDNGVQQSLEMVSAEYKLPLVWIDLEMTGFGEAVEFLTCISLLTSNDVVSNDVNQRYL